MLRFRIPYGAKYKTMTRAELYELVWSEPMRAIAPRFGISDVGLRKVCLRADIPVPKAGYWAKVHHGKRVERRPKLPGSKFPSDAKVCVVESRLRSVDTLSSYRATSLFSSLRSSPILRAPRCQRRYIATLSLQRRKFNPTDRRGLKRERPGSSAPSSITLSAVVAE